MCHRWFNLSPEGGLYGKLILVAHVLELASLSATVALRELAASSSGQAARIVQKCTHVTPLEFLN